MGLPDRRPCFISGEDGAGAEEGRAPEFMLKQRFKVVLPGESRGQPELEQEPVTNGGNCHFFFPAAG